MTAITQFALIGRQKSLANANVSCRPPIGLPPRATRPLVAVVVVVVLLLLVVVIVEVYLFRLTALCVSNESSWKSRRETTGNDHDDDDDEEDRQPPRQKRPLDDPFRQATCIRAGIFHPRAVKLGHPDPPTTGRNKAHQSVRPSQQNAS